VLSRRYLYTLLGGGLAGVGGAYLSLVYSRTWIDGLTAGRGWIAVGLVVFGTWDPMRALAGAYLFGFVDGFQLRAQALGSTVPSFFLNMLPYLFTVLVVAISSGEKLQRRLGVPRALGIPYWREERT
jgi:general nucleoside transport system permease protein